MHDTSIAKVQVYNKLAEKSNTAWIHLRNDAAHGRYSEYDDNDVLSMVIGIRDFISRYPA